MAHALRTFTCPGCGEAVEKRAPAGAEVHCIHCAIQRSISSVYQMRSKSGVFYERWAASMARVAAEAETLVHLGREIDSIG